MNISHQKNPWIKLTTKNLIAVMLFALAAVVFASLGLTFSTPGKPIEFLGLHLGTADSHFIPPIAGLLVLFSGFLLLLVKPQKAWSLPQAIADALKRREQRTILDGLEAERLDRIRNPSKYRGK